MGTAPVRRRQSRPRRARRAVRRATRSRRRATRRRSLQTQARAPASARRRGGGLLRGPAAGRPAVTRRGSSDAFVLAILPCSEFCAADFSRNWVDIVQLCLIGGGPVEL